MDDVGDLDDLVSVAPKVASLLMSFGVDCRTSVEARCLRWQEALGRVLLVGIPFSGLLEFQVLFEKVRVDRGLQRVLVGAVQVNKHLVDVFFVLRDWEG